MKLLRHFIETPFDLNEMIGHKGMADALLRRIALGLGVAMAVGFLLGIVAGKFLTTL